jgi:hypothetical protein
MFFNILTHRNSITVIIYFIDSIEPNSHTFPNNQLGELFKVLGVVDLDGFLATHHFDHV